VGASREIPASTANGESGGSASFLSETTEAGEQSLVPGVRPLRLADRLSFLASAPLAPTKPQRAIDFGLFDMNARNQLDLFASRPTSEQQT
jgi:hypothetical protein